MSSKITKSAACNCGGVRITVTGKDKSAVHCYCANCQRATGSAFAHNRRFVEADMQFEKGKDLVKEYADGDTLSGNVIYRHFCTNCGSQMYLSHSKVPDFIALHEGSMEGPKDQPTIELFPEEKYAWFGNVTTNRDTSPLPWDPDAK